MHQDFGKNWMRLHSSIYIPANIPPITFLVPGETLSLQKILKNRIEWVHNVSNSTGNGRFAHTPQQYRRQQINLFEAGMEPTKNLSHLGTTLETKHKLVADHVYQWATVAAVLLLLLTTATV